MTLTLSMALTVAMTLSMTLTVAEEVEAETVRGAVTETVMVMVTMLVLHGRRPRGHAYVVNYVGRMSCGKVLPTEGRCPEGGMEGRP
jgi:hypothetical protein